MNIKETAEDIVNGLNNLDNNTNTVQKIAYSYKDKQIEIVLLHLKRLSIKQFTYEEI